MIGRRDEARALFERLLGLANDVGPARRGVRPGRAKRMLGNFPQAFTHVALVNTAFNLALTESPARHRSDGERGTGMGALPKMPKRPAKAPRPTARDRGMLSRLRG